MIFPVPIATRHRRSLMCWCCPSCVRLSTAHTRCRCPRRAATHPESKGRSGSSCRSSGAASISSMSAPSPRRRSPRPFPIPANQVSPTCGRAPLMTKVTPCCAIRRGPSASARACPPDVSQQWGARFAPCIGNQCYPSGFIGKGAAITWAMGPCVMRAGALGTDCYPSGVVGQGTRTPPANGQFTLLGNYRRQQSGVAKRRNHLHHRQVELPHPGFPLRRLADDLAASDRQRLCGCRAVPTRRRSGQRQTDASPANCSTSRSGFRSTPAASDRRRCRQRPHRGVRQYRASLVDSLSDSRRWAGTIFGCQRRSPRRSGMALTRRCALEGRPIRRARRCSSPTGYQLRRFTSIDASSMALLGKSRRATTAPSVGQTPALDESSAASGRVDRQRRPRASRRTSIAIASRFSTRRR